MIFPAFACYGLATMRTPTLLATILAVAAGLLFACADEEPIDEPADGSAEAWESCRNGDGVRTPELCADPLVCVGYGFCAPPCAEVKHCAAYGFGDQCDYQSSDEPVCIIECLDLNARTCPDTGGVKLRCDPLLNRCQ